MAISSNLRVIAAICGNFWQESTVNPGIWERKDGQIINTPGYGLGQWTDNPPIVERRTALFNYLDSHGYARDSGDGQLEFLVYENIWIPTSFEQSAYSTLTEFFESTSNDLEALTREWMYHWEGINDGSFETRYQAALHFLNFFWDNESSSYREPWFSENEYLTLNEASWNSMRIMDFFLENEPPEPPEPPRPTPTRKKRKGLPPWLIYQIS